MDKVLPVLQASRVRRIWNKFDKVDVTSFAPSSCSAGCAGCCHQWIGVQYLEAVEAVREAITAGYEIDRSEVERQASAALEPGVTRTGWFPTRCVFLDQGNRCAVYAARPLSCRALRVISDPRECSKSTGVVSRYDNRRLSGEAGRAIQGEHMQLALAPVVAALPVMVGLVLRGEGPASLGKAVGLVGLDAEISDAEVDARLAASLKDPAE